MKHKLTLEGFDNSEIEVERSLWTGRTTVYKNGELVTKGRREKFYELKMDDGSIKKLKVKGAGFDTIPRIYIDEKEIRLTRKLSWNEHLMALLPLSLLIVGGAIGGVVGAIAAILNYRIIRSNMHLVLKLLSIILSLILAWELYFFFAGFFQALISQ